MLNILIHPKRSVRANADVDSLVPRWYQRAKLHRAELFADDAAAPLDPDEPASCEATAARTERSCIRPAADAACLAAMNQSRWSPLDECRLDPARPGSGIYQRKRDLRVSATDPDAALLQTGEQLRLGYRDQYVVDGGRARIILAALVTPADVMENQPMLDLLWRVRFRWHLDLKRAIGDTAYGTLNNIPAFEDAGLRAFVPFPDWDTRPPTTAPRTSATTRPGMRTTARKVSHSSGDG